MNHDLAIVVTLWAIAAALLAAYLLNRRLGRETDEAAAAAAAEEESEHRVWVAQMDALYAAPTQEPYDQEADR